MHGMEPEEREFWVLLTIFGALFALGPFLQSILWSCLCTLTGLGGLVMLIRDRVKVVKDRIQGIASKIPIRTPLRIVAVVSVSVLAAKTTSTIVEMRNDLDEFVVPRNVTKKQAEQLKKSLSQHEAHAVIVKVNPLDQEALQYAAQLEAALSRTDWSVTFSTASADPNTLTPGLEFAVALGNGSRPDPKHDPERILEEAFQSADITVNGSGGAGGDEYKLFVLVGHRPLRLGDNLPMLYKIGRWIETLGLKGQ
jgi:hypothetical protein